jgi:hypothetical protein
VYKAVISCTVIFNADGGDPATETRIVEAGKTAGSSNMPAEPARDGKDEAFEDVFKWDFSAFMTNTPVAIPEWPDIPDHQDDGNPQTPATE